MSKPVAITQTSLVVLVGLFLGIFHNFAYFRNIAAFYSDADQLPLIILSTGFFHIGILWSLLSVIGFRRVLKPLLVFLLLLSSMTAYFIDTYNVVIDQEMLVNVAQTNKEEVSDLLTLRMALYFLLLGVIPALFVYKVEIIAEPIKKVLLKRFFLFTGSIVVIFSMVYISSDFYASFLREHKILRFYANPSKPLESSLKYVVSQLASAKQKAWLNIGEDAQIPVEDDEHELVVLVIGETARADNFSLNGYPRITNPELAGKNVISFKKVSSCGTTTAVSLPCMFSIQDRASYSQEASSLMDNALDVLKRAGVSVLWRENNTGHKGVADHVEFQDFRDPKINPVCDIECRDEGMLSGLDQWIEKNHSSDLLIVLHQMGSHGPAYYKRYPASFEKFTPACKTSQLEDCSEEEIRNAYDNTILYTDHFLAQTIDWLKTKSGNYEVSLMYVSDHGESLGESGLYLHGFPYTFAPDVQTHVPAIFWGSANNQDIDIAAVQHRTGQEFTHDNLFHTLLGLFEVKSEIYQANKDMLDHRYRYE